MDGLVIFGMAIYFAYSIKKELPDLPKLEVRKNPNFIKDESAFLKLYNKIMGKDS